MARNDERRAGLADAALRVLAREGTRGLTHRAVDAEAGAPVGTASNYFRNRPALISAIADRITIRLAPEQATLDELGALPPSRELFAAYIRDIVRRLTLHRELSLALFELRLEAGRRPELADVIGEWLRTNFEGDVAFNAGAGLPGGRAEIAMFHYALDGLLLDRLTTSIDPDTSTDDVVAALVEGLLPDAVAAPAQPRAEAYVIHDGSVLVCTRRPTAGAEKNQARFLRLVSTEQRSARPNHHARACGNECSAIHRAPPALMVVSPANTADLRARMCAERAL